MPSLLFTFTVGVAIVAVAASQMLDFNTIFMRFFRDVARNKARKRLYGDNENALIPMLLGREEFVEIATRLDNNDLLSMTREELSHYRGQEDGIPLYLSIQGRIYDVSGGSRFYGPGKNYHLFVGTDATRAFATGCTKEECVSSDISGLSEKEMKEVRRWIELYETHDKYTLVGFLVDDPVDAILELDEQNQEPTEEQQATESTQKEEENVPRDDETVTAATE